MINIHPSSIVDTKNIGEGTKIWAFVHILKDVTIGSNCNINDHVFIENGVKIGDNVTVKCGVWLWDGITLENNVFIGPSATFTNDRFPRSKNTNFTHLGIVVKEGASVGANATILPGITIGKYAMVGAGSVVTKDVEDFALVYGNPAKNYGYVCKCGEKLSDLENVNISCKCGLQYKIHDDKIQFMST